MIKTERSKFSLIMTVAAVAAGLVLRLSYPLDIEFKADERWTFEQVRAALSGDSWLWSGMPTSIGGLNPGASLWVFIPLGWLFGADTPPQLARGVQCMNCAALIALVLFALRSVRESDREPWLGGRPMGGESSGRDSGTQDLASECVASVHCRDHCRLVEPPRQYRIISVCLIVRTSGANPLVGGFLCCSIGDLVAR
ncbi:MAG TPA: hypothetical protein VFP79_00740 [Pseudolabrys sp.]|nr:hypothetical protein [Pseudolabrys sp.]